jgi:hypothetical protein
MSRILKKERNISNLSKYNIYSPNSSDLELDNRDKEELEKNRSGNKFFTFKANQNDDRASNRNYSQSTKNLKLDRVRKLSEKLSKLQVTDTLSPLKLNKLETKLQLVEENYSHNLNTLKSKYATLKEHTEKMKAVLETANLNKDELRKNVTERLRNLQIKVKSFLNDEKQQFKEYTENITNKLEAELIRCEIDVKRDEDTLLNDLTNIKDNIKVIRKLKTIFN